MSAVKRRAERLDRSVLLEQQAQLLRESQLVVLSGQRMEAIIHARMASFREAVLIVSVRIGCKSWMRVNK